MLLTAIKSHCYSGKSINSGDTYEAREPYADALVRAGVSRPADKAAETPQIQHSPQPAVPVPTTETRKKKRKYQRRDMRAVK